MSFANEAVYKSISAINDLKNDKDIEIKIKPLIDFKLIISNFIFLIFCNYKFNK